MDVNGEASIVADDVRRGAVVHDLELAQNLLAHRRFGVDEDELYVSRLPGVRRDRRSLTFLAMILLRFLFHTLVTVPPLPAPRSDSTSRSSSLTMSSLSAACFFFFPFVLCFLLRELVEPVAERLEVDVDPGNAVDAELLLPVSWRRGGRGGGVGFAPPPLVAEFDGAEVTAPGALTVTGDRLGGDSGPSGPDAYDEELERPDSWRSSI